MTIWLISTLGFTPDLDADGMKRRMLQRAISECNIVFVTAVGNGGRDGVFSLDQTSPQNLATDTSSIITVGGVNSDGTLDPGSSPQVIDGNGGSITIYAQSRDVQCAINNDDSGSVGRQGASLAAPAVVSSVVHYLATNSNRFFYRLV